MKYRFIESCAGAGHLPTDGLCSYLGVARSGYYKWLKHEPSHRAQPSRPAIAPRKTKTWAWSSKRSSTRTAKRMAVRACVIGCVSWVGDTVGDTVDDTVDDTVGDTVGGA